MPTASCRPRHHFRRAIAAGVLFLLALGSHTPLFRVLYAWVPGFGSFRGNSKFIFEPRLTMARLE